MTLPAEQRRAVAKWDSCGERRVRARSSSPSGRLRLPARSWPPGQAPGRPAAGLGQRLATAQKSRGLIAIVIERRVVALHRRCLRTPSSKSRRCWWSRMVKRAPRPVCCRRSSLNHRRARRGPRVAAHRGCAGQAGGRRIAAHEVEQVPRNAHVVVRNPGGGDPGTRRLLIGRTDGDRCVTLVIEQTVDATTWLIVTGWASTSVERKLLGA